MPARKRGPIALAPIARLVKQQAGIERISKAAVQAIRDAAIEFIIELAKLAAEFARHAGRKTVKEIDVKSALRALKGKA
ncbi:MAG: histone [bacterium]|nr:histone [bacterium]